jgi:hypothetical protein
MEVALFATPLDNKIVIWPHCGPKEIKYLNMGNCDEVSPKQWLEEQFEFEWCEECGGDHRHHEAVGFLGNWFARCLYPMVGDEFHSKVKADREAHYVDPTDGTSR